MMAGPVRCLSASSCVWRSCRSHSACVRQCRLDRRVPLITTLRQTILESLFDLPELCGAASWLGWLAVAEVAT